MRFFLFPSLSWLLPKFHVMSVIDPLTVFIVGTGLKVIGDIIGGVTKGRASQRTFESDMRAIDLGFDKLDFDKDKFEQEFGLSLDEFQENVREFNINADLTRERLGIEQFGAETQRFASETGRQGERRQQAVSLEELTQQRAEADRFRQIRGAPIGAAPALPSPTPIIT